MNNLTRQVDKALEEYRFNDAALALYHFTWHELCDWYLEVIKPALTSDERGDESRAVLAEVLERTLRLLHPIIPFITEEIWQKIPNRKGESIMMAEWPRPQDGWDDPEAEAEFEALMDMIGGIRNIRGELNIPPNKEMEAHIQVHDSKKLDIIMRESEWIRRLAKLSPDWKVGPDVERPKASGPHRFRLWAGVRPHRRPHRHRRRTEASRQTNRRCKRYDSESGEKTRQPLLHRTRAL